MAVMKSAPCNVFQLWQGKTSKPVSRFTALEAQTKHTGEGKLLHASCLSKGETADGTIEIRISMFYKCPFLCPRPRKGFHSPFSFFPRPLGSDA
jgi:hypothetical protein